MDRQRRRQNLHNSVEFHLLRDNPDRSVGDPACGNLLVEGDNLLALKALLPYYAGKVKCIYIDPPYKHSFWLQTSTDKFYPDFVCKLTDGSCLVVEYKGHHL